MLSPSPNRSGARRKWHWAVIGVVGLVIVLGVWLRFQRSHDQDDRDDPSLLFEEPWHSEDHVIENGRAYDQGQIALTPGSDLVLPLSEVPATTVTVRRDGPTGVVTILLEKRRRYFGHPGKSLRLRDFRNETKLWKRQVGPALVIDFDRGGIGIEGGTYVHAILTAPSDTPIRQEGRSSPWFASRYEWPDREGKAQVAGWVEVPQQPLPRDQFR